MPHKRKTVPPSFSVPLYSTQPPSSPLEFFIPVLREGKEATGQMSESVLLPKKGVVWHKAAFFS